MITKDEIVEANRYGLECKRTGEYCGGYHTPILEAAAKWGEYGVDLSEALEVKGFRLGMPECGISWNHRDNESEWAMSLLAYETEDGKRVEAKWLINIYGEPNCSTKGLLVPGMAGSDGEPLMIPYGNRWKNWDKF